MAAKLWDAGQVREFEDGDQAEEFFRHRHFAQVARIGLVVAAARSAVTSDQLDGWELIERGRLDAASAAFLRPARGTEVLGLEVVL